MDAEVKVVPIKRHWLYGEGPNNELRFKVDVEIETDCSKCAHNKVCSHAMMDRCANYEFGSSEGRGCLGCIKHYTRFDHRQPVPCFSCADFMPVAAAA